MTLKELFQEVEFDQLIPYLKEAEAVPLDNVHCYREAFDILRNMVPNENYKGEVRIEWSGEEYEEQWIAVRHLDDYCWEKELSKEIVVADDVSLSMEGLAAKCLWSITFYNFSPKKRRFPASESQEKALNEYEKALEKLEDSILKHQIRRKLWPLSELKAVQWIQKKYITRYGDELRMNRAKRKQRHRQKQRQKFLESMGIRTRLIDRLTSEGSSLNRKDVEYLFQVQYGTYYDYQSVTAGNGEKRLEYIAESITKYQSLDLGKYDDAIVCIYYPTRYPIDEEELHTFKNTLQSHYGYDHILYGTTPIDDHEDDEVVVLVALSKR